MKRKVKVSKFIAKYMGVMSLAISVIALNNYSIISIGEPKLPKDII